jgi:glutaminyl-peptide cyclotransferase
MNTRYSRILWQHLLALALLLIMPLADASDINHINYQIIHTETHNANSFIQGWDIDNGIFYESSGLYGKSFVQRYQQSAQNTLHIPSRYFAEGLTIVNNQLYLLTWKENTLFTIDPISWRITGQLSYAGEGWGLTHNHQGFIMSNGTPTLFFRDFTDFSVFRTLTVRQALRLNELEYVSGVIWANSWYDDNLYAIHSQTGCILGKVDLSALRRQTVTPDASNILNGIAYDADTNGFWVTGKYWPKRYLLQLDNIDHLMDNSC